MLNQKATVSSKGQVVIPRAFRAILGIHAGTELIFDVHNGILEARPVKRSIEMFFGCCKREGEPPLSVEEMDRAIMKSVMEKKPRKRKKK